MPPLTFLTVTPTAKHTATVIFAHGLGDSGQGWLPVARMLAPALPHVKWILPNAPSQRITLAGGQAMPAWFDILSLEKLSNSPEDEAGMLRSKNDLQALALTHSMDIPSRRCVIGGFSQGCAMALLSGLTGASDEGKTRELSNTVAGVIALSGWLPLSEKVGAVLQPNARNLPIFWGHGTQDQVVKYEFGRQSADFLTGELGISKATSGKKADVGLRFESYPGMEHSSSPQEIRHIGEWLAEVLPPI